MLRGASTSGSTRARFPRSGDSGWRTECLDRGVERLARPHHRVCLLAIDEVVAAEVDALALNRIKLAHDRFLVTRQPLRERRERVRELRLVGLVGERLRPVECEVEMAAAVVE